MKTLSIFLIGLLAVLIGCFLFLNHQVLLEHMLLISRILLEFSIVLLWLGRKIISLMKYSLTPKKAGI